MLHSHSTTPEYRADYLAERIDAYQNAYADGDMFITWLGCLAGWLGRRLVAWRQRMQPGHEYMQPQNSPPSWVS